MININLVPSHLRKKPKVLLFSDIARNIPQEALIGLVGGLIVLLFVVHFILLVILFSKYTQRMGFEKQWQAIKPQKEKTDVVLAELRTLQNKINSIEKVTTAKRIFWAQKLNDIADAVSRGIWLNKISLDERVLLIEGSAVSKTGDEMTVPGSFVANLKGKKSFMNGLENIEVGSYQKRQVKSIDVVDFLITVKLK